MALNIYVGVCRVCRETANGTILSRCTLSGYLVWGGGGVFVGWSNQTSLAPVVRVLLAMIYHQLHGEINLLMLDDTQ